MSTHKQILDPLSTLCKLALLSFYENGSKISISTNIIEIHKNNIGQWALRRYTGASKDQIFLLHNPIIKAIEWYILNKKSEELTSSVKNIIYFAINGLEKLKKTYKDKDTDGNVILAIQFLINNLKLSLIDNFSVDMFSLFNGIEKEQVEKPSHILNYEKIQEIWNLDTIRNISNQLTLCDKNKLNILDIDFMLESLSLMLRNTDAKFKKLVNDMNEML